MNFHLLVSEEKTDISSRTLSDAVSGFHLAWLPKVPLKEEDMRKVSLGICRVALQALPASPTASRPGPSGGLISLLSLAC